MGTLEMLTVAGEVQDAVLQSCSTYSLGAAALEDASVAAGSRKSAKRKR